MRLVDRIFPRAETLRNFAPPDGELPTKALPFILIFVHALRWSIGIGTCAFAVASVMMAIEPYFLGKLVDAISNHDRADAWQAAWPIVTAYFLLCQMLNKAAGRLSERTAVYFRPMLVMLVRRRLAGYLFTHSYRFFQDDFAGRLAGKVVEMPQAVHDTVHNTLGTLLQSAINGLTAIILFATLGWKFAVAGIGYFLVNACLYRWLIPQLSQRAMAKSAAQQRMRGKYLDSITNILIVKLFAREKHEDQLFSAAMIEAGEATEQENRTGSNLWFGQELVNAVFQIVVLTLAIEGYRAGALSPGQVAMALTLALSITLYIWWLLMTMTGYFSNIATIDEALSTIVVPAEVQDAIAVKRLANETLDVAFDAVTFGYPGHQVFEAFQLDIPQGQRVGLVGPSGAGKSTLVQLILRLFDVQGGVIRIGGQDIREVAQADLRQAIAVIPQSTDLMHRSIRDNIAYGNLEATQEQIMEAAKKAFIHDTILGLKDSHGNAGYDSLVGERGVKLSGGQRQRVAIARAFLKNAPILILDEATSALDSESERLIQQSLDELFKGRTVIVIAHRLSTIAHLDRIVVMEHGRIVEDGPHATLVNSGGLYAHLWQLQSAGFLGG